MSNLEVHEEDFRDEEVNDVCGEDVNENDFEDAQVTKVNCGKLNVKEAMFRLGKNISATYAPNIKQSIYVTSLQVPVLESTEVKVVQIILKKEDEQTKEKPKNLKIIGRARLHLFMIGKEMFLQVLHVNPLTTWLHVQINTSTLIGTPFSCDSNMPNEIRNKILVLNLKCSSLLHGAQLPEKQKLYCMFESSSQKHEWGFQINLHWARNAKNINMAYGHLTDTEETGKETYKKMAMPNKTKAEYKTRANSSNSQESPVGVDKINKTGIEPKILEKKDSLLLYKKMNQNNADAVIGIDFGNESCFVTVTRAGGIETVDNDYSLRATPSFVAFGARQRVLGVAAKNQAVTNLKNTIFGFKRYLGRRYDDPRIQEDLNRVPFKLVQMEGGGVGIKAMYLGNDEVYTPEQVTAMLFTKLKETAENAIQAKVHDCVISVPSYFTDAERRALLDATKIAGLHVLRLLNETAAAALNYGIYKQDLPEPDDKPRNVVIVDCGHSAMQVAVSAFNKGKLKVLASVSDPCLGGRNFDAALATHFCTEFRSNYGIDADNNPRAYMRLMTEVEKIKKQMSANATKLPLNIECFMEEKDVTSSMCRADFEQMCAGLFQRAEAVLQKCLTDSKLDVNEIHSVEIVGGSTRIPAIKLIIEKVFQKTPSTTLNQDESVSRGCGLLNATIKEFTIDDVQSYSIKLVWEDSIKGNGEVLIFPQYHPVAVSRELTLCFKESMIFKAVYVSPIPFPTNEIGKFAIKFKNNDMDPKLKVTARINMHGIFSIYSATIYEKVENGEEDGDKNKTKKVHFKAKDLPVDSLTFGLSRTELDEKIISETHMISRDRNEKERLDSRNALEEYIYDLREKLDMELSGFVEDHERQKLYETLSTLETWLYEDGSDEKREVYLEKLQELKIEFKPVKERGLEREKFVKMLKILENSQQVARKAVELYLAKGSKYEHIPPQEMEKVKLAIKESEAWLQGCPRRFGSSFQPHMNIPIRCMEILEQRRTLETKIFQVLNTPKPKIEPPKEEVKPKEDAKAKKPPGESTNVNNEQQP